MYGCDGMVDIGDLKSSGVKSRAGSSPVTRTIMESYSRGLRDIPAKDVGGHTCVGSNPTGSFELSPLEGMGHAPIQIFHLRGSWRYIRQLFLLAWLVKRYNG